MVINMSKKFNIVPFLMILILIFCPSISLNGAARGLEIWWRSIVPSLFPFMAVSTMLVSSGVSDKLLGRFSGIMSKIGLPKSSFQAFIVGIISGFPVGAGMINELYNRNAIDRDDVCYAASISSFCSPAFMLTAIGAKLLNNMQMGLCIMIVHYVSFIFVVAIWGKKKAYKYNQVEDKCVNDTKPFGKILATAVEKAAKSVINVGGYIVLFSILIEVINKTGIVGENSIAACMVSSFLEISNGCSCVSASALIVPLKMALISFAVSWGGLCVMCQISGYVSECGVSAKKLFAFKLLQGFIAAALGYIAGIILM